MATMPQSSNKITKILLGQMEIYMKTQIYPLKDQIQACNVIFTFSLIQLARGLALLIKIMFRKQCKYLYSSNFRQKVTLCYCKYCTHLSKTAKNGNQYLPCFLWKQDHNKKERAVLSELNDSEITLGLTLETLEAILCFLLV